MYTVDTAEIRWFYKGEIPTDFISWFKSFEGLYDEQSARTDLYLKMNDDSNYGIKLREGRFEIKKLITNRGILSAKQVEGIADTWRKWSMKADEQEHIDFIIKDTAHWVAIEKERSMQRFAVDESNKLLPQTAGIFPPAGIGVELSRVTFKTEKYWTFGMEAFGDPNQIFSLLQLCFKHFFHKKPPTSLSLDHAYSYPEWLRFLANQD